MLLSTRQENITQVLPAIWEGKFESPLISVKGELRYRSCDGSLVVSPRCLDLCGGRFDDSFEQGANRTKQLAVDSRCGGHGSSFVGLQLCDAAAQLCSECNSQFRCELASTVFKKLGEYSADEELVAGPSGLISKGEMELTLSGDAQYKPQRQPSPG